MIIRTKTDPSIKNSKNPQASTFFDQKSAQETADTLFKNYDDFVKTFEKSNKRGDQITFSMPKNVGLTYDLKANTVSQSCTVTCVLRKNNMNEPFIKSMFTIK